MSGNGAEHDPLFYRGEGEEDGPGGAWARFTLTRQMYPRGCLAYLLYQLKSMKCLCLPLYLCLYILHVPQTASSHTTDTPPGSVGVLFHTHTYTSRLYLVVIDRSSSHGPFVGTVWLVPTIIHTRVATHAPKGTLFFSPPFLPPFHSSLHLKNDP